MIAAIRIRGKVNVPQKAKNTLKMLKLETVNSCVILSNSPNYLGMLERAKDYMAYGEIDKDTFVELLKKRGKLLGNKRLTEDYLKKTTKFDSFEKFVDAVMNGKAKLKDVKDLKTVFRLNPPRKGMKSIKLPYPKGALGYRKENMNEFLRRMI